MKRFFPVFLLIFSILAFFQPFLLRNLLPIPSDTLVGLYHPFRDVYATQFPRGVPFKNFLITDPVLQQYPWKNLAISVEKQLQLPLWNPYSFSGMPLLGNLQSSPLYPGNILFLLLPFSLAWSYLIVMQSLLAGLFFYLYARNLQLSIRGSFLGSIVFTFSGFSLVWLEWGTIIQTGLWLPLVLLSIDKLFFPSKKKYMFLWSTVFIGSLASSFLAGHLQTFFYISVVSFLYLLARVVQYKYYRKLFLFALLSIIFLAVTAIQWIPLVQLIQLSARSVDHIDFHTPGWFIPWQNLAQFIAPDFFGNPATLNYFGIWNYMEFSGYVGLFPLILAIFALLFLRLKKVYFFGALFLGGLLFSLPTPIAILPFVFHIPFIETSQPTRLLFIIDFSLSVLTAISLSSITHLTKKLWISFSFLLVSLGILWGTVFLHTKLGIEGTQTAVSRQNLLLSSAMLVAIFITLLVLYFLRKQKYSLSFFSVMIIVLTGIDLFRFGYKFTPFTQKQYLYPSTKTLRFLQTQVGNNRIMETNREILSPNSAVMYRLQSVDGYDPLYLMRYGEYIAALERGRPDINPPFGFNRIITPHNFNSPLTNLLGVKYILSTDDLQSKTLKKVFQEGESKIYENTASLPRVFFVDTIVKADSKQKTMNDLFALGSKITNTAVVETAENLPLHYSLGQAKIQSYMPSKVTIETQNASKGFLIFTDIDYPTWHVSIDKKETKLFLTDYIFRGVEIPAGNHIITFYDSLF